MRPTLEEVVAAKPFRDFTNWWPMGENFLGFMADAIYSNWRALFKYTNIAEVSIYTEHYLCVVYGHQVRSTLVRDFAEQRKPVSIHSGEFDALSYAFFRSAFEELARRQGEQEFLVKERREFTRRVGKQFFINMATQLKLDLPKRLDTKEDHYKITLAIEQIGAFLLREGYLHSHFAFRLDVNIDHRRRKIRQKATEFLDILNHGEVAYALYEMGHAAIMPSAYYLYNTIGEAQHHSSRTIEELFDRVGCIASETSDFHPPSSQANIAIELWEIQKKSRKVRA